MKHISKFLDINKYKVEKVDERTLDEKVFDLLEKKDQEIEYLKAVVEHENKS